MQKELKFTVFKTQNHTVWTKNFIVNTTKICSKLCPVMSSLVVMFELLPHSEKLTVQNSSRSQKHSLKVFRGQFTSAKNSLRLCQDKILLETTTMKGWIKNVLTSSDILVDVSRNGVLRRKRPTNTISAFQRAQPGFMKSFAVEHKSFTRWRIFNCFLRRKTQLQKIGWPVIFGLDGIFCRPFGCKCATLFCDMAVSR